jgi:hypothetical protein
MTDRPAMELAHQIQNKRAWLDSRFVKSDVEPRVDV